MIDAPVGDGVPDIPSAVRRQYAENLPIEVKFPRRVVEDADPYGRFALPYTFDHFLDFPTFDWYNSENNIGF